jgi:two-component system cell cycle sensor histidine kinase/response regulator CckA
MSFSSCTRRDPSNIRLPASHEQALERIRILQAALDVCGSAVMVVDTQGKVLAANSTAEHLHGIADGVTLPPAWMASGSPLTRALKGETPQPSTSLLSPRGTRVQLSAAPLNVPGLGSLATVTACTVAENDEPEEMLRCERDWAWSIIETVGSLVVVLDREGRIVSFNFACQTATGYAAEEMLGKVFWEYLLIPEEVEGVRAVFQDLRADHFPNSHENYWVAKDGSRRLISWSSTALSGRNGEVEYVIGTGVDITELRHRQDELRQVNETLGAVIDTSPLAIVAMDLAGRVVSWNRAAERIFGWSEEEVLGQVFPAVPEDDMAFFHDNLERIRLGEVLSGVERNRNTKGGAPVAVALWNAPRRNAAGEVVGAISVIADVTERKRLEDQFRQSQKMEAVGRLAGGVAHDFNNLLTVITGYSQMVLDTFSAEDMLRGYVEEVLRAAESAAALTNQLLAFSRRQVVQPQVLDLNTLVVNVDKMLHRLIGEDIELVTALSPSLPKIKVDPGQFQQVLMNLVVNARDAMPDGGRLTIETTAARFKERDAPPGLAPGNYVELSVRDTGKGMDEEIRRRLFEPFFTTKARGKGTGLGLSTAYGIVKQSGGDIWVTTEPGKGSQFQIYLPAAEEAEAAAAQGCLAPSQQQGVETILLVEDETGLRKLVREVLRAHGYAVLQAGDVREAMRICEQHLGAIHLFLTDVVMPHMSGRELAEHATALRPGMKVLYMSGYTDVIAEQPAADQAPFLQKPFTPDALLAKIRDVLDED